MLNIKIIYTVEPNLIALPSKTPVGFSNYSVRLILHCELKAKQ